MANQNTDFLTKGRPLNIYTFVHSFAEANVVPTNWKSVLLPAIEKNDAVMQMKGAENYCLSFFTDLCILNYTDLSHIRMILNKDYLEQHFKTHTRRIDYLNLLNLYQAATCRRDNPLKSVDCKYHLAKAFDANSITIKSTLKNFPLKSVLGRELVLSGVVSKHGHFIPHVVIQKKSSGEFVNVSAYEKPNDQGFIQLEHIKCNDDERM